MKFNSHLMDWILFSTKVYDHIQQIIADKKFTYKDKDATKALVNDIVVQTGQELNWTIELTTIRVAEALVIIDEVFYWMPHPVVLQE